MAGIREKRVMRQGLGTPESAADQGKKAGPQASSSCDRSSALVGDLAVAEYKATRKKHNGPSSTHFCEKNRNCFCYICSKFEVTSMRKQIVEDIKKSYEIFGLVMVQHINWVPTIICNSCRIMLNRWKKDKNIDFIKFSIPAKWNEPYNEKDCYFCSNEISGFTSKTKNKIIYTTVMSLTPPISVDRNKQKINETSVNVEMMGIDEYSCDEENTHRDDDSESDSDYSPSKKNSAPSLITQSELSDVIRNLGLPKDGAEYLASFLKKKHLLASGTKVSLYRNRDLPFRQFFTTEDDLVLCTNVQGLINELKTNSYRAGDWRLFIDSSKRSIKTVLLHNTNIYAPVPIAHSTVMQENYNNMQVL